MVRTLGKCLLKRLIILGKQIREACSFHDRIVRTVNRDGMGIDFSKQQNSRGTITKSYETSVS